MPPYKPDHIYSIDEFLGHFDHFASSPGGTKRDALIRYFATHYPNRSEGLYKANRFSAAFSYMMRNLHEFQQFVVVGEQGRAVVSKPLVVALARYFGQIPQEYLDNEPDPAEISLLARESLES